VFSAGESALNSIFVQIPGPDSIVRMLSLARTCNVGNAHGGGGEISSLPVEYNDERREMMYHQSVNSSYFSLYSMSRS
jgi:hypothetical protein